MIGNFMRQLAIFDPAQYRETPVVVIGAGGIGSGVLMGLAKMGVSNISVYDDDMVEAHNIPNQFYTNEAIGVSKVESAKDIARDFSPDAIEIEAYHQKADGRTSLPPGAIVIFAVDSLAIRKSLFTSGMLAGAKYLIDARMGGDVILTYNVDLNDSEELDLYLESVSRTPHKTSCAAQAIAYTILLTAGIVCSSVRNVLTGDKNPFNVVMDAKGFSMQTPQWKSNDEEEPVSSTAVQGASV
jgi:molybdopterin/thiamine biosynthesis adenylyltransferase